MNPINCKIIAIVHSVVGMISSSIPADYSNGFKSVVLLSILLIGQICDLSRNKVRSNGKAVDCSWMKINLSKSAWDGTSHILSVKNQFISNATSYFPWYGSHIPWFHGIDSSWKINSDLGALSILTTYLIRTATRLLQVILMTLSDQVTNNFYMMCLCFKG